MKSMMYHMRRTDKEFKNPEKLRKVLKETEYVTLAMVKDNEPYLVSMSHGYDDENNCIYIHSANEGKKLDYLKKNPVVWGQALMDHGYVVEECSHRYVSVMFKGRVTFLESVEEKRHAFKVMISQLEPNPESIMDRLLDSEGIRGTIVVKIMIEYITGKKTKDIKI